MKAIWLIITISIIIGLFTTYYIWAEEYAPGEILVKFKALQNEDTAFQALRTKINATKIKKFEINNVYQLKLQPGVSVESAILTAYTDPNVEYAEPNYKLDINALPNDPSFSSLYGLHNTGQTGGTADADIDAPEAWDIVRDVPENIIIAVIDTGVDYNHPDLAANIWTGPNGEHGYDFYNNDSDPMDDHSHGTHVAGTIAGVGNNSIGVVGVAWHARIMAVKFLGASGSGSTSGAISAIQYAVANGAKILSNSWGGGGYSQALKDAITASHNAGTLFVAAAGNSGTNNDTSPHYPSSYDVENIIAVAATDHNDNLASFSCYGPTSVDLAAPGVGILSTVLNGGYASYSGTSMATPHVSGVCALVWAYYPQLTNLQIKARLLSTADIKSNLQGKILSNGRANLYKALTMGQDNTPPANINDLAITSATYKSATLTWTAVGDDNLTGTASIYDIRYSTSPIDENNFGSATTVTGTPVPKQSGSQETFTVQSLSPNTTYYFAIKVLDEWGNTSGISNIVSTTTGNATILFQDKVENGMNGWTISGTDGNSGPALWHLSQHKFNSTTTSWYYADEKKLNYDTGKRNYGSITSPTIDLTTATSADLIFTYWRSVESYSSPYDVLKAEVSYDNGSTWQTLWTKSSTTTSEKVWISSGYISLQSGSQVKIRFSFDTGDAIANNFEGIYIDDIEIVGLEPADTTPPAAITDLAISKASTTYVTLQWTAPGDDGNTGKALSYDIRYNKSKITNGKWKNATLVIGEPKPAPAGTLESFTVTELTPNTKYYFAIKSIDNANNESGLSNVINTTTLTPPKAVVDPTQMPTVSLEPNKTTTKTLTISNTGGSPLEFSLTDIKVNSLNTTTVYGVTEQSSAPEQNSAQYIEDEILVKTLEPETLELLNAEIGAETINEFKEIGVYHIKLNGSLSVQEAIKEYGGSPHILYAEPNYIAEAFLVPNDPQFTQLYGLNNTGQTGGTTDADIDAPEAWNYFTGSTAITVAVIDTGVDYNHPDLAGNIQAGGYDFYNNDPDPMDDHGHGTHVSGTIGGIGNNGTGVAGINWTTKILPIKFLSAGGSGSYTGAINSILYSVEKGAKISSNSWGGSGYSQALKDAIEYGRTTIGQLFIAAAGNSAANSDVSPLYPAAYDCANIISVAATDHNDALAYFSNYGPVSVDLGAPGVSITSTFPNNSYKTWSGTSMATPHVSGAAALIWAQKPELTYDQVKSRLLSTVDPISSLSGKCTSNGRLNIYNAIQKENDPTPPTNISNLAVSDRTFQSITLTWTAVGDDGNTGTATLYDLRYSTSPITDFNTATQVAGEPTPAPSGSTESVIVTGLNYNTTYYFAIKVMDNVGNWSGISNIASGATKVPTIVFQDDMENGTGNWTAQSPWSQTTNSTHSGVISWTTGYYTNNLTANLVSATIDLTKLASASMEFWHKYEIEKDYDYGYIEISTDGGTTWTQIKSYTGTKSSWGKDTVNLTPYTGKSIKIRFKLVTDASVTYDGWYIDDVVILGSATESGWLKPDITSGIIPPNASTTITFTYDATGLDLGSYSTQLNISTDDPDNYLIQVLASLIVESAPPTAPPNITITQPADGALFKTQQINVSGTIDYKYSVVTVNGVSAVINNTTWGATITLSEGQNTITVIATNSAGSTTKSITVTLDTTAPTISITSPANGYKTKSTTISASGSVSDNIGISSVTVNSQAAAINGNIFTANNITLQEGSNTILAQATDTAGNTKTTSITVIKDTTPPAITITSPADGSTTLISPITVTGTVDDPEAIVTINGSQVTIPFSKAINLTAGLNTITVIAVDTVGNTSTKSITISYVSGPKIDVSPATIPEVVLGPGQTTTQTMIITNTGDADLVYSIGVTEQNSSMSEAGPRTSNTPKGPASDIDVKNIPEHHPSRLLVKFKPGVAEQSSASINALVGAETIKIYEEIGVQKVEILSNIDLKEAIAMYMQSNIVEYAELDYVVKAIATPNDPYLSSLWGMSNISASSAWDITKGSGNVLIGVTDTGVDYTHPDIAANWSGIGYDFYNNDPDPMDDHGHGTHVSGTIAGVGNNGIGVVGVNWTAKIMGLKFLSAGGWGYTSDAIDATIYGVNHGARILSNSWGGGGYSQGLKDAIEYANSHNVLFVAAAGNAGSNNDQSPSYPASYDCSNIIAVAAINSNNNLASWSCYGPTSVDIGAPGVGILSTLPGNSYASWSGTSMATPHVSGVAGLILSQNLNQTDEQVKAKIMSGAVPTPSLSGKCVTGGRLNAYNSIDMENDTTPPSAITNLSIPSASFQSATLTWNATGDDGNSGTASSYDVRYSTSLISEDNFNSATQATGVQAPKSAGSAELFTVSGLSETTQYYFAIKAIDNAGNKSGISNIAQAITTKGTTVFSDNMESDTSKWLGYSPWGLVTNAYKSATHSFNDSPGGNYQNNITANLITKSIDLSNYNSAQLTFWHKYDLETGYDYCYVYVSIDNGAHWTLLKTYNGHQNTWIKETINLTSYCGPGRTNVYLCFQLVTDYSIVYDGWYIDDVTIMGSNNPLWLSASPASGVIGAGQSKTITLSYSANVIPGDYTAEINITSNAVNNSSVTVTAQMKVNTPTNAGKNAATVIASSEYSSQYMATNVIDGIKGVWDEGEWASQGWWDRNPWIRVLWNNPQTVNTIIIYGRPNRFDKISDAKLTLSTGYSMRIGEIPIGGAGKVIQIPASNITWLQIDVLETNALNPGLTEIELYNTPTYQNKINLAISATATASSEYSNNYIASKAIDGVKGLWDAGEWAAQGSWDRSPWLKLTWSSPQTINKIVIYGRPNRFDSIQNAKITLSNGYTMTIGEIPIGGAGKEIYFPTANITWLEFKVLETTALNAGLTEIEAYYEATSTNTSNIARQATATSSSEYSGGYLASNSTDGIKGVWDQGEWAAQGSWDRNPWLKLTWGTPQTVNKIVIYGRPNRYDSIQNAKITLSNGYTMTIGEIPSGGAKKEIYFPTANITWLEFRVLETTAWNPGLTEIEVYYEQSPNPLSLRATESSEAILSNLTLLTNPDTDGDGIYNRFDAFDLDPTEWEDTDGDGIGNNMDWDDDDDKILDEDDAYPLDIKKSTLKNILAKLIKQELNEVDNSADAIFLTVPEDAEEEDIKAFIDTSHEYNVLVLPIISTEPEIGQIEPIIDMVIENDYDGIVTEETNTDFIKNFSAALHNRGKQLVLSIEYEEGLDIYDIAPYIDKLILRVPSEDTFEIESAILDIRMQLSSEKIIIELDINLDAGEILQTYNISAIKY